MLYWPACRCEFVNFDDNIYVTEQPMVQKGLTRQSVLWAIRDGGRGTGNWQPLTIISYQLDILLAGGWKKGNEQRVAAVMHLHNIGLHACNTVMILGLLIWLLNGFQSEQKYKNVGFALLGTLMWAWHPLRVESVAWVASRKDVLCLFWYLAGHLFYIYALRNECRMYFCGPSTDPIVNDIHVNAKRDLSLIATYVCCVLALISKPIALVYPGTLALLEIFIRNKITWMRIVGMSIVAFLFLLVVMETQQSAMVLDVDWITRFMNVVASIGSYLSDTLWAKQLCCFYPYEIPVALSRFLSGGVCCLALGILLFGNWFLVKTQKMISIGILWFLIALIPVSGLVLVGMACRADRYMYLPAIGLSMVVVAFFSITARNRWGLCLILIFFSGWIGQNAIKTRTQIETWKSSETLLSHALVSVPENYLAAANLAAMYGMQSNLVECLRYRILEHQWYLKPRGYGCLESSLYMVFKMEGIDISSDQEILSVEILANAPLRKEKTYAMAYAAFRKKLYLSAQAFIQQCIDEDQKNGYAWELYARILLEQNNYENAYDCAVQALRLLPQRGAIQILLKDIRSAMLYKNENKIYDLSM